MKCVHLLPTCFIAFVIVILYLGASSKAFGTGDSTTQSQVTVFYGGGRHSEIEPCGCKTKQQGGVQYEAALGGRDAAAVRVDAGEWAHPAILSLPVLSLKTTYLLRALAGLKYDALNVSYPEASLSPDYYANLKHEHPEVFALLVSANVFAKAAPDKPAFAASRIVARSFPGGGTLRIGITGATSIDGRTLPPVPGALPLASIKPKTDKADAPKSIETRITSSATRRRASRRPSQICAGRWAC